MSSFMISLLFSIGFGGWIYGKTYHKTGGNARTTIITSVASGLLSLIIIWIILSFIFK